MGCAYFNEPPRFAINFTQKLSSNRMLGKSVVIAILGNRFNESRDHFRMIHARLD